MKSQILLCKNCNTYTLKNKCPNCDKNTITPKPAKFSLEDKYQKYRLKAKENEFRNKTN